MEDYCKKCDWKACEKFKQTYDSTMRRIGEIRARYQAASEGPWITCRDGSVEGKNHVCHCKTAADAEFIAHAREDLPDCLEEIEWVYGVFDDLQRHLDRYGGIKGIDQAFHKLNRMKKLEKQLDDVEEELAVYGDFEGINAEIENEKRLEKENAKLKNQNAVLERALEIAAESINHGEPTYSEEGPDMMQLRCLQKAKREMDGRHAH